MLVTRTQVRSAIEEVFGREPRPFQEEVAHALLNGCRGVVLRAPTGSGKTWAAVAPFIVALKLGLDFPSQLVYSLPMRTLANSLQKEIAATPGVKRVLSDDNITLQTGECPNDRYFESIVTFATIDQTISSVLGFPLSLPRRLANIPAAGIMGAYRVWDEVHLLDAERALKTVVHLERSVTSDTPFLMMTATLSQPMLRELAEITGATPVWVGDDDLALMPEVRGRSRVVHAVSESLSVQRIWQQHARRSLVVVNRVDRAQALYHDLRSTQPANTEIILLHSRFLQRDRKRQEKRIMQLLGPESRHNVVAVATQVVEVGLNISAEVLHTELAPANSLVQRVGRCARFQGEGTVWVYDVHGGDGSEFDYAPYVESAVLCRHTWEYLYERQPLRLDVRSTQQFVDVVHSQTDRHTLRTVSNAEGELVGSTGRFWKAIESYDPTLPSDLIRDVQSTSVVLSPSPSLDGEPYDYESIGIHPGTLSAFWRSITEENVADWVLVRPQYTEDKDGYDYTVVSSSDEIQGSLLLLLNSRLCTYSTEVGLDLGLPGGKLVQSPVLPKEARLPEYSYPVQTYERHIETMLATLGEGGANSHIVKGAGRLLWEIARILKVKAEVVWEALLLSVACHDLGKMSLRWQNRASQIMDDRERMGKAIDAGYLPEEWAGRLLSHTFHVTGLERERIGVGHSMTGAVASMPVVRAWYRVLHPTLRSQVLDGLCSVICTAIADHHAPGNSQLQLFKLSPEARMELARALVKCVRALSELTGRLPGGSREQVKRAVQDATSEVRVPTAEKVRVRQFRLHPRSMTNTPYEMRVALWKLYYVVVRVLRLADQRSFGKVDPDGP